MADAPIEASADAPIAVLFVVTPHAVLLDLAGPAEAFRLSNQHLLGGLSRNPRKFRL